MKYTMGDIDHWAKSIADKIIFQEAAEVGTHYRIVLVGIPRGGIPAAYAIAKHLKSDTLVASIDEPDSWMIERVPSHLFLVDDITTTGETIAAAKKKMSNPLTISTAVLVRKQVKMLQTTNLIYAVSIDLDEWVEFPWEAKEQGGKPLDAVTRLIEYVGDDPTREGLLKTPERFLRFLDEQRIGEPYEATVFKSDITDLQVENNIPFSSLCEHHLLPYFGTASVGYIPNGNLLGLSKLVRILADHGRGLTMQEVVTAQTAAAIENAAGTPDVAVITTAQHTCMIVRGVKAHGSSMSSSAMLGKFRESPALRAEFMTLAGIR